MILTITLNPSVDISYKLPGAFSMDTVNRVADVSKTPGGKGLNVTRVLHQLGENVAATGFLGGSLGEFISKEIAKLGVHDYFAEINGTTRNCIAVIHEGQQTEILENGPSISEMEANSFLEKIAEYVQLANFIVISGSLPNGVSNDYYNKILSIAGEYHTPVLLDTNGKLLEESLRNEIKPFLIKPNQEEMGDLLGKDLMNETDIIEALNSPIFEGVSWLVVTLGGDGAIVKHNGTIYRAKIPKVNAVNPVGSGDSVMAGFASGLASGLTQESLIKFGLSMGVLNAMNEKTGQIDPTKIEWCVKQMQVSQVLPGM